MRPFQITIFTKDECSLCDHVKERVETVAKDVPIELQMFDITTDPNIYDKYKWTIPVVHIDGDEVFISKMTEQELRDELAKR
jgi:glutaredoxin